MEGTVIQINDGITINVDVSVKNIIYLKNIRFGILLYVVAKMEILYLASIIDHSVNKKFLYFTCLFINYHCIIDRC